MKQILPAFVLLNVALVACASMMPTAVPTSTPASGVTPTAPASIASQATSIVSTVPAASDLLFVPDPGLRVENASNPAASVDASGTVYLFYEDRSSQPGRQMVATSSDGLKFSNARQPTSQDNLHHPYKVRLPDGTWRRYLFDPGTAEIKSESSSDGINYKPDFGIRYKAHSSDNGTVGVYDNYVDPAGGVVLLYIGDMMGVNNVRRAYSKPGDNGWIFTFEEGNVLGDANAGGGSNSYVDPKSILLPDGRRRLFVMMQGGGPKPPLGKTGGIFSFVSSDGKTYTFEPGTRLQWSDFTEFQVASLNDPIVVRLPDGRYRMYVAALLAAGSDKPQWAIVSATTPGPSTQPKPTPASASPQPTTQPKPPAQPTPVGRPLSPISGAANTYWVNNPTSGARLYVQVFHPKRWDGKTKLPALVLVPGGSGSSDTFTRPLSQAQTIADAGFNVVIFDPDGRGQSGGREDYDGFTQQDGLAAVIRFAATLPEAAAKQIGVISYSYGVTMAAGALARYSDLPARFLIDWEGPADRNDTGGCDASHTGHLQRVASCTDEKFWSEHEASTFIAKIRVPYQRIQSEKDHAQPDVTHAINMINAAVRGGVPWVRLNDLTPNQIYDPKSPPKMLSESMDRQREALVIQYAQELQSR